MFLSFSFGRTRVCTAAHRTHRRPFPGTRRVSTHNVVYRKITMIKILNNIIMDVYYYYPIKINTHAGSREDVALWPRAARRLYRLKSYEKKIAIHPHRTAINNVLLITRCVEVSRLIKTHPAVSAANYRWSARRVCVCVCAVFIYFIFSGLVWVPVITASWLTQPLWIINCIYVCRGPGTMCVRAPMRPF